MPFPFSSALQTQGRFLTQSDNIMLIEDALRSVLEGNSDRFLSCLSVIDGPCTATLFFYTEAGDIPLPESSQLPRDLTHALYGAMYNDTVLYPDRLNRSSKRGMRVSEVTMGGTTAALVCTAWIP